MRIRSSNCIFRKMQKDGIVLDAVSYVFVIQHLCIGKRLENVVEFWMDMSDVGHLLNVAT